MTSDIDYGFTSTDEVEYDKMGAPLGCTKCMAIGEEADDKGRGVIVEWEALEGDSKGKKFKIWYLTKHDNPTTRNIAKQNLKRIADATGKEISAQAPIKGRVCVLEARPQKNDADRTEVFKYHAESYVAPADNKPPF